MNLISKLPIQLKTRALRYVRRKRIAISDELMCDWFDFQNRAIRRALWAERIGTIPISHPGWYQDPADETLAEPLVASLVRYPLCIELETTLDELQSIPDETLTQTRAKHARYFLTTVACLRRAFDVSKPGAVGVLQGYESLNAAARQVAIERDLPVIAFENTALKDRVLWDDHSAITTNRNLAQNFYWRYLDEADEDRAKDYCERLVA